MSKHVKKSRHTLSGHKTFISQSKTTVHVVNWTAVLRLQSLSRRRFGYHWSQNQRMV